MAKRYNVRLSGDDRRSLQKLVRSGKAPARALTHARILLNADETEEGPGWQDEKIAEALETSVPTVARTRKRFIQGGLDDALYHRRPSKTKPRKLDGHAEAHLIALSCTEPPNGRDRWTMQLLADKLVELYDSPPISDVPSPLPARPGTPRRQDYEYERRGIANLFLWYEPLMYRRHVEVTERRTMVDRAHRVKDLVDVHYPEAEVIVLARISRRSGQRSPPGRRSATGKRSGSTGGSRRRMHGFG